MLSKLPTSSYLFAVTIVFRALAGFAINKLLAVYFGAKGVALLAHFQNLVTMATSLPADGVNRGIIRNLATDSISLRSKRQYFASAIVWNVLIFLVFAFSVTYFDEWLVKPFAPAPISAQTWLLVFLGAIFLHLFHLLFGAALLGMQKLVQYVWINIAGSLIMVAFVFYAILERMTLYETLLYYAAGLVPALLLSTYWMFRKRLFVFNASFKVSVEKISEIGQFVAMALSVAVFGKLSDFIARNWAIDLFGLETTGLWQAVVKVSDGYMMLIPSFITMVYYPQISSYLEQPEARKKYIRSVLKIVIISSIAGLLLLFFLGEQVLVLLNSKALSSAAYLIRFQFLGDFFRIISLFISALMWLFVRTRLMALTEILSAAFYLIVLHWLIPYWGIEAFTLTHCIRYVAYCGLLVYLFRKEIF
jgi:O-antigen/teichoic acid export membrane protein